MILFTICETKKKRDFFDEEAEEKRQLYPSMLATNEENPLLAETNKVTKDEKKMFPYLNPASK